MVYGRCVQGPERIHRDILIHDYWIPTSRSRVADCDPDYDRFYGISSTSRLGNLCTDHCSTCAALAVRAMMT